MSGSVERRFETDIHTYMKGALGMGLLYLTRLLEGGLRGLGEGLLHWEPWKICSGSLQIWASLSIRASIVPRGTWCLGRGGGDAPILGNLKDE